MRNTTRRIATHRPLQTIDKESVTRRTYELPGTIEDHLTRRAASAFWTSEMIKFQALCLKGDILDLGCGAGRDSVWFQGNHYRYVGIDLSRGMIGEGKQKFPNRVFAQMNIKALGFKSETFNGIWAASCLFHIERAGIGAALDELRRVTKPGGWMFITMRKGEGESLLKIRDLEPRLFVYYSQDEFASLLESSGFRVAEHKKDMRSYNYPSDLTIWLVYFVQAI